MKRAALLIGCLACCAVMAQAADYYVDAARPDNSGDGLSWGAAWKTISYAVGQVTAGDTINVAAGTYNTALGESFPITIPASVRLVSAATRLATIEEDSGGANALVLNSYATLEGFSVKGNGTGYLVQLQGTRAMVRDNLLDAAGYGYGVYISSNSGYRYGTIEANVLIGDSNNTGIHFERDTYIRYNEIRGFYFGLYEYRWDTSTITVENNTIVQNTGGVYAYPDGATYYQNNIIACNVGGVSQSFTSGLWRGGGNVYSRYNDIFANEYNWDNISSGEGDVSVDAQFVDADNKEFQLSSGSPCIGSGTPEGTDMGAYPAGLGVTVAAPNGGEYWQAGIARSIAWNATGDPTSFRLYYTTSEVIGYQLISGEVTGEARSYNWTVPDEPTSEAKIRIEALGSLVTDESDAPFNIVNDAVQPVVTLESLTGGETVIINTMVDISWEATDNTSVESITLFYSTNEGASWTLIASGEANDGRYAWLVPDHPTDEARIRIIAYDVVGLAGTDESGSNLTILADTLAPVVTVEAPNGGETISGKDSYPVSWEATDDHGIASITIQYSLNNGASWATAATGEANDGLYWWTVPNVNTDEAKIKVIAYDVGGNAGSDESDGPFTIVERKHYYVDAATTEGNVVGSGAPDNPWQTISWALTQVSTGDAVHVAAGRYTPWMDGSAESFPLQVPAGVTLTGEGADRTATIEASGGQALILYADTTLEGFTVRSPGATGSNGVVYLAGKAQLINNSLNSWLNAARTVYVSSAAGGSRVNDNKIWVGGTTGAAGILAENAANLLIENNSIESTGANSYAIMFGSFCTNAVVRGNLCRAGDYGRGLTTISYNDNLLVDRNTFEVSSYGYGIFLNQYHSNYLIQFNLIKGAGDATGTGIHFNATNYSGQINTNEVSGFSYGVYPYVSSSSYTCYITNNTIVNNSSYGVFCRGTSSNTGVFRLKNNIINNVTSGTPAGTGIHRQDSTMTVASTYDNCWNNSINWNPAAISGVGTMSADPLFVDAAGGDYHLTAASPCIDKGTPEGTDLGCYQYVKVVTVDLRTPNGGEIWQQGQVRNITWEASGPPDSFRLYYTTNEATGYHLISGEVTGEARSYPWLVTSEVSGTARIRIEALGSIATAESAGTFNIVNDTVPPVVTLESLTGGQTIDAGTTVDISWEATDDITVESVSLHYSTNEGAAWTLIASREPNTGRYPWLVPNTPTDEARVRVTAYDAAGLAGTDESGANFTIDADIYPPLVTVEAPNGGESWYGNAHYNITWQATDERVVASIRLEYSLNNGASWNAIASGEANDGVYRWLTPNVSTTEALIKVIAYDGAGNVGSDESDATFTLVGRTDYYVNAATAEGNLVGVGAPENPWQTITYALGFVTSGDTIHAATGEYTATMAGSRETFPLTLEAGVDLVADVPDRTATIEAPGGRVVHLKGSNLLQNLSVKTAGPLGADGALLLTGRADVVNNLVTCGNSDGNAVYLIDGADQSLVQGNTIHAYNTNNDIYYGIYVGADCDQVTISGNQINCFWYPVYLHYADQAVVQGNTLESHSSYGRGIHLSNSDLFDISRNVLKGGNYGVSSTNMLNGNISSNEVTGFRYGFRIELGGAGASTVNIFNNTLVSRQELVGTGDLYGLIHASSGTLNVKNNIFCGRGAALGQATPMFHGIRSYAAGCTATYNDFFNVLQLYYESGGSITRGNNIERAPRFVDPDNHDYRLRSDSPCAGAGEGGAYQGAYPPIGTSSGVIAESWVDAAAGSDSNTGTELSPFRTITHALSTTEYYVNVKAGTYNETHGETLPLELAQWQTLRSVADPGHAATIEGLSRGVTMGQKTSVEGFSISGTTGIYMFGVGTIAGNRINSSIGINVDRLHDLVSFGPTYVLNNHLRNATTGIRINYRQHLFGQPEIPPLENLVQGNTIEVLAGANYYGVRNYGRLTLSDNLISGSGTGYGLLSDGTNSWVTTIEANEIRDFTYGINISNLGGLVEHNTVVGNRYGFVGNGSATYNLKNNIICGAPSLGSCIASFGLTANQTSTINSTYNDVWNVNRRYVGNVNPGNDLSRYPRFVSEEAKDHRIYSDSPCATAGEAGTYQGRYPPIGASSVITPESWIDAAGGSDTTGDGTFSNPWRRATFALDRTEYLVQAKAGTHNAGIGESFPLGLAQHQWLRSEASPRTSATLEAATARVVELGQDTTLEGFSINTSGGSSGNGAVHLHADADALDNDIRVSNAAASGVYVDLFSTGKRLINNLVAKEPPAAQGAGVYFNISPFSGTVATSEIRGFESGIYGYLAAAGNTLEVYKNTIVRNNQYGVYCRNGTFNLFNNIVSNVPGGGAAAGTGVHRYSGTVNSAYDDVWNNATNWSSGVLTGAGTISADPAFVSVAGDDYRLYEGSPCIDAGTPPGTEMGRYDGFVPLGMITLYISREADSAGSAVRIYWTTSSALDLYVLFGDGSGSFTREATGWASIESPGISGGFETHYGSKYVLHLTQVKGGSPEAYYKALIAGSPKELLASAEAVGKVNLLLGYYPPGLELVALPVVPDDPAISNVIGSQFGAGQAEVWSYYNAPTSGWRSHFYNGSSWSGSLPGGQMVKDRGYWLKSKTATQEVSFVGRVPASPESVSFNTEGLFLYGSSFARTAPWTSCGLHGIFNTGDQVWQYDGGWRSKNYEGGNAWSGTALPGLMFKHGFWIKKHSAADTWTYPPPY